MSGRGPQLDGLEHFGEGHPGLFIDRRDVGNRVCVKDAYGSSTAGNEESSEIPHHVAAGAGLARGIVGRLLGGRVLIPGHAGQLPENEECCHPSSFTVRARTDLPLADVNAVVEIEDRGTYVLGVRIFSRRPVTQVRPEAGGAPTMAAT